MEGLARQEEELRSFYRGRSAEGMKCPGARRVGISLNDFNLDGESGKVRGGENRKLVLKRRVKTIRSCKKGATKE